MSRRGPSSSCLNNRLANPQHNQTKSTRSHHAASSTSPPVSRARAASQCLKIVESCKRSSRHARDLIRVKTPADKRETSMSRRDPSSSCLSSRRAHPHLPLHPSIVPPRSRANGRASQCLRFLPSHGSRRVSPRLAGPFRASIHRHLAPPSD